MQGEWHSPNIGKFSQRLSDLSIKKIPFQSYISGIRTTTVTYNNSISKTTYYKINQEWKCMVFRLKS
jgi:hypothetical protein